MAQPPGYTPTTDFSADEAANLAGRSTVRTSNLDTELANIAATLAVVLTNLALIQRDDTKLVDRIVELHALSDGVRALVAAAGTNPRGDWITATAYAVKDVVNEGTGTYLCAVAHTSGVFATDLAADKWMLIFDTAAYVASGVSFIPTGTIASTNVQLAIAEAASEAAQKSANLSDLAGVITARLNLGFPAIAAKGDSLWGTAADTIGKVSVGADGEILMPAAGTASGVAWLRNPFGGAAIINGKITRSVAGNALTISLKTLADADPSTSSPVYVMVPSVTSNVFDGGYVIRKVAAALSLVISSGSTLGHASAVASPVYVYLLDNAGALELAVSNKFFGSHSVQSSTAEGGVGGADSGTVLYSTTARSNAAVSCLQRWKSTQTTAGTWAATTGEVQLFPFPYKAPSVQTFTASGTYTKPWDLLSAKATVVGAGAGGAGSGTTPGFGGNGGSSSFGSHATANGGAASANGSEGGVGGTASGGDVNLAGATGAQIDAGLTNQRGGVAAGSIFGGAGRRPNTGNSGGNGVANTGGSGAGAGCGATVAAGAGGGAGSAAIKTLNAASIGPTETVTVGTGGTAGAAGGSGFAGGAGGSGIVIVEESYV